MKFELILTAGILLTSLLFGNIQPGKCQNQTVSSSHPSVVVKIESVKLSKPEMLFFYGIVKPEVWSASTESFHAGIFDLSANTNARPNGIHWQKIVDDNDVLHVSIYAWRRRADSLPTSTIMSRIQKSEDLFLRKFEVSEYFDASRDDKELTNKAKRCKSAADKVEAAIISDLDQWEAGNLVGKKTITVSVKDLINGTSPANSWSLKNGLGTVTIDIFRGANLTKPICQPVFKKESTTIPIH